MKIYNISELEKGTQIIAQRTIPSPRERYPKGALFVYLRVIQKVADSYAEIVVAYNGYSFTTYDDYFRKNAQMAEYIVTIRCIFDEA